MNGRSSARDRAGLVRLLAVAATTLIAGAVPAAASAGSEAPGTDFHQLMAEIAAERGAEATAAEEYLNAAERSADPAIAQRAAEYAFEYGFDAWALRAARRWVQVAPAEAAAQRLAARLLVRRHDIAGAARHAAAALGPVDQRTSDDFEVLADAFAGEQNSEAVARVWTRLAATAADSATLQLALGAAALRAGDAVLAEAAARAALALRPESRQLAEAEALIARARVAAGDTDGALAGLQAAVAKAPSLDLDIEAIAILAADERHDEALAALTAADQRHPDEPRLQRLRAAVTQGSGDFRAAWEAYRALVEDRQYADEANFRLAEIAIRQEQYEQAVQLLSRIGDGPWLLPAQDGLARLAEAGGEGEAAERLWRRVAERYPKRAFEADAYRAALLQRLDRKDEALRLLTRGIHYRPDDAAALVARGALLEQLGRFDDAIADMTAAVRLRPDSPAALNALGYTLTIRTRRFAEARDLIRRAIERQSDSAPILDSYGWVLFRQGQLTEARSWLQQAYAELPDPEIAAHLGEVMWRQGERDAARGVWREARERDPDNAPLKETMARFGA
jgi:tetratricopeptide (TPR) repeat protein